MTTKTSNRKLISIESAKDTDGTDLSIYKYEVEKNGKTVVQTVKTRKTRKYKENKFNVEQHLETVLKALTEYFNSYEYKSNNQEEEFRQFIRDSVNLKLLVDELFNRIQIKLTQLELKKLITTHLLPKMNIKVSF